ncbi:hypothetical protein BJ944DRAFT_250481 [Cunninghamella echinulata]|nr:hypothetical protein BJ944DRAFT_250481 [Cunninghamella echinulata]
MMISEDRRSSKSVSSDSLLSPNDTIVRGPNGNTILCDSPQPNYLPKYAIPDQSTTQIKKEQQQEQKKPMTSITNTISNNDNTKTTTKPSSSTSTSSTNNNNKHNSQLLARRVKPRRVIGNYTLVSTLGAGSMGKVRLAIHNITQDKLAVKIVPRVCTQDKPSSEDISSKKKYEKDHQREIRTIREASIMLLLHHPYIVSLKEMVVLDPYYYMFMEYVDGGQLLDFIISHGKLKERHARRFSRQIISALDYCHRNSIVHRDLKIENILISSSGHIKIIDFGLSNLFSPKSHLSTFCGSLYFAAPELLNAKAYTGPEVDIWSFGIVLYVLVCGKVPFDDQNMAALHEKIKRGVVDYPSYLSSECKNILSRMLVVNPSHRATTAEITIHPWMNKGFNEPIDNYLPDRVPLTLPIDMEVVRGMTGFEFGTEDEIKNQLESIIQSDEYQKAAATLAERRSQAQQYQHQHQHAPNPLSRRRPTFYLPNDDPQSIPSAYHPLVSIYYLVKERLEREKQQYLMNDSSGNGDTKDVFGVDYQQLSSHLNSGKLKKYTRKLSITDHATSPTTSNNNNHIGTTTTTTAPTTIEKNASLGPVNTISMPEAAHTTANSTYQRHGLYDSSALDPLHDNDITTGISYGENGKTQIHIDDNGHIVEVDKHISSDTQHGFGKLFNWHHNNIPIHPKNTTTTLFNNNDMGLPSHQHHHQHFQPHRNNIKKSLRQRRHTNDDRTPSSSAYITELFPLPGNVDGSNTNPLTITNPSVSSPSSSTKYNDKRIHSPSSPPSLHINTSITKSSSSRRPVTTNIENEDHLVSPTKLGKKFSKMLSRRSITGSITSPTINNNNNNSNNTNSHHRHTFHIPPKDHHHHHQIDVNEINNSNNININNSNYSNNNNSNDNSRMKGHRLTKSGSKQDYQHFNIIESPGTTSSQQQNQQNHQHEQIFPSNAQGVAHHIQGTADEQVKPIFLKGLFSVSTTSTKHPSVIRADLIRVLERIGVKWRESKSRFECVHVPSIDMNRVMIDQDPHQQQHHHSNSSSSSSSFHQQQTSTSSTSPPSSHQHHQQSVIPNTSVTVPDLVVRFEIYIVKVPWLGMHGLQFRRVSGDTWQYKNMCSRILAELKL